jgi:putative nucleotidyltransferase with HDIG domain
MIAGSARLLERYFNLPTEQTIPILHRGSIIAAILLFIITSTIIVASEHIFPSQFNGSNLNIGEVAARDIFAPRASTYVSEVLTDQRRQDARNNVRPVYNPPDLNIARTQSRLTTQILDYIDNVRRDTYATAEQRIADIQQISALTLEPATIQQLIALDEEAWSNVRNEINRLLEQVMQDQIRDIDLAITRERLPNQVSLRFDDLQNALITEVVSDLLRPNSSEDQAATARAQQTAADAIQPEQRTFQQGQLIVREGTQIGVLEYEALQKFGLLQPEDRRLAGISQALIAVLVVSALFGMYLARFRPSLLNSEPRLLLLLAVIFLMFLFGLRITLNSEVYLFPAAALALMYVAIVSPQIGLMAMLGFSLLGGIMANNSLEITTLFIATGVIGALVLRRPERLNSYFIAGLLIALMAMTIATLFALASPSDTVLTTLPPLLAYGLFNGVLVTAATVIGLYLVGIVFNLPTALRLIELSQPGQPLLQRLLREAPGTYQHSLQVATLGEQAANAIGANATLVHVAALYHDIGKVLNPAFFTENQRDIGNPHDALNDPHRSADIIISHVTEGDRLAAQQRLPKRIRDFIREHHGTSLVYVFYRQAVIRAGDDESAVDTADFMYPGPKPQTRETALLMLADSCEATIRSLQPNTRKEIEEAVARIIESKQRDGQLDASGLTLKDLSTIRGIFVDILQATFHPRIDYTEAVARARGAVPAAAPASPATTPARPTPKVQAPPTGEAARLASADTQKRGTDERNASKTTQSVSEVPAVNSTSSPASSPPVTPGITTTSTIKLPPVSNDEDDDSPLPTVPPLPRINGRIRDSTEMRAVDPEQAAGPLENPTEPPYDDDTVEH